MKPDSSCTANPNEFKKHFLLLPSAVNANLKVNSNFGDWCVFDSNVFCQERDACENCARRPCTIGH